MEESTKELKEDLENSRASWLRYYEEAEALKVELTKYKNLCKAQSEIISNL